MVGHPGRLPRGGEALAPTLQSAATFGVGAPSTRDCMYLTLFFKSTFSLYFNNCIWEKNHVLQRQVGIQCLSMGSLTCFLTGIDYPV